MPPLLYAVDITIFWLFAVGDWIQRNAAVFTVLFTVALIYFTRELARITRDLHTATKDAADAATKSADTASDAFTKLERPYVFVFGVSKLLWRGENRPSVSFSVGNYGKSPAIIEEVFAGFDVEFEPKLPLAVEESHRLRVHPVLAAGGTQNDITDKVPDWIDFTSQRVPVMEAGRDFFFRIVIHYRGPFTSGHETSACWHYDRHEGVLTRFGGDDYNYIDKES